MDTPQRESTPLKRTMTTRNTEQNSPLRTSRSASTNESRLNLQFWGQGFINDNKSKLVKAIDLTDERIYEIYSGETHLFINTKSKNIYGYGNNKFRQIDTTNDKECNALIPLEISQRISVDKIFCGCDFTFMMASKVRLYSWGFNAKGQLGLGHNDNVREPTLVKNFHLGRNDVTTVELPEGEVVIEVQCGSMHAMIHTNEGRLLSTGFGETYALGHGTNKSLNVFKEIVIFTELVKDRKTKISKIELGVTHSCCLISKKLFIWGMYGKDKSQVSKKPIPINSNIDVSEFFLGDLLTVLLTESGDVYAIGDNFDDQLTSDSCNLVKIHIPHKMEYIAGGLNHVFAVNFTKGKIYAWGSNRFGQIMPHNSQPTIRVPTEMTWMYQNGSFALTCKGNSTFFVSKILLKTPKDFFSEANSEKVRESLSSQSPIISVPEFKQLGQELETKTKNCEKLTKENLQLKDEISRLGTLLANTNKQQSSSTADTQDPNNEINDCKVIRDINFQRTVKKGENFKTLFRN